MFWKIIENDDGGQYRLDGVRTYLLGGEHIVSPEGTDIGCVEFETEEEAAAYFGLDLILLDEDGNEIF